MPSKAKRLFSVVLASALACAAFAQSKLTGVEWKKVGEGVELQIQGENLAKPKTFWTNKNRSYMLEFDAHLVGKAGMKRVNSAGVKYFTYGWFQAKPPKVRVHVYMEPGTKPELSVTTNSNWMVSIGTTDMVAKADPSAFPEEVPPLDTAWAPKKPGAAAGQPSMLTQLAASPVNALPPTNNVHPFRRKVSLMFEATEIVQILKALALQADVNIVTAPDVTGKLSVSLNDVDVQQALDFVTTLAGVRYALVGNTFVVATNGKFAATMRQIENGPEVNSQTRIIGLMSGEGAQIKATVLKAVPQESILGRYDILLPTEVTTLETKAIEGSSNLNSGEGSSNQSGDSKQGKQGASNESKTGEGQLSSIETKAQTGGTAPKLKDMYLVLVGMPKRLDDIERVVREVDMKIADAARVVIGQNIDTAVIPLYSGRSSEVANSIRRMVDRDPKRELYDIQESSAGGPDEPDSVKLLMVSGPSESVKNVEIFAKGIDAGLCKSMGIEYPETQEDSARGFEVFDLKFVEPLEAAVELQKNVPGLRASVLPSAARPNPRGARTVKEGNAEGSTGTAAAANNSGLSLGVQGSNTNSGISANSPSNPSQGGSAGGEDGFNLIKNMGAEPMKVMVRGTRAQIEQARQFLAVYDMAPKQVALELRVIEMTKEQAQAIGIDWSILSGGKVKFLRFNNGISAGPGIPGTISSGDPSSRDIADAGIVSGTRGLSFTATLDQLAANFKMIARPNVLATEGRPTDLFIGDEVRYVEAIINSQNGTTIVTKQVNVGVKLRVTPRVGASGNLMLDLSPEMSVLKGFTDVPGGGKLPQTSMRSSTSMVQMMSGETLAIGGLIQESDRMSASGVPILMDLPIIGHLFKRTVTNKVKSEVVFFLTATEVGPDNRGRAADPRESAAKNKGEFSGKSGG